MKNKVLFRASTWAVYFFITAGTLGSQTLQPLGIGLESLEYPYPVHFMEFEMQGQLVRMGYMDVAPTGTANGQTIVLMHGKNFGSYYWGPGTIGMLTAAGYRVVAPDQIGWGKSSKPELHYSFHGLAANTARLLDTLGIQRAVVLGHSTGGMLAVRFALSYPERVSRLIIEDPIGLEDYRTEAPAQTGETLFRTELANSDPVKLRAFYAGYFVDQKPELYGPLAEIPARVALSGEWPRWAKASALTYRMIYEQPVRYEYSHLQPPVLLLVGEQDHAAAFLNYAPPEVRAKMGRIAELARAAVKEIPHGTLVVVPRTGHIPHLERPAEFRQAVLEFLEAGKGTK
jgi:pimeloyl-ACP methyl ester carboxylesterase